MSKVRLLILSSFAAGFGLCSIIFSIFTMASELSFGTMLRFLLTAIFFGINILFTVHYYVVMLKDMRRLSRAHNDIKRITPIL